MSTVNQRNGVCASCSKCERAVLLKELPVNDVNLALLSNDEVPDHLLPVSYNVTAYEKALLNAKGMSHPLRKEGVLKLCAVCHMSLKEGKMPKFALANYYISTGRIEPLFMCLLSIYCCLIMPAVEVLFSVRLIVALFIYLFCDKVHQGARVRCGQECPEGL